MAKKGQHVVPHDGKWSVLKAGSGRSTSVHATQAEAIAAATKIAQNQKTDLYIHGLDGRIREKSSFSTIALPSKD